MLRNVSYNDKDITREINETVGKPFGLRRRFSGKAIGSPKLWIHESSEAIQELLEKDSYINTGNIELRPRGIIFRFRSKLETYALVIPYHQLTIFKGKAKEISLYGGADKVVLRYDRKTEHAFFTNLMEARTMYLQSLALP